MSNVAIRIYDGEYTFLGVWVVSDPTQPPHVAAPDPDELISMEMERDEMTLPERWPDWTYVLAHKASRAHWSVRMVEGPFYTDLDAEGLVAWTLENPNEPWPDEDMLPLLPGQGDGGYF